MRAIILSLGIILGFIFNVQLVYSQTAEPTADQLLAAEILNSDDDPTNDVTNPSTIDNATTVISTASATAVTNAVTAVANSNPLVASAVAASAASNNSGVSIAAAASSANVSTVAVTQAVVATVVSTAIEQSGGVTSEDDLINTILEDPSIVGDLLPGLSDEDAAIVVFEFLENGSLFDGLASGAGLT